MQNNYGYENITNVVTSGYNGTVVTDSVVTTKNTISYSNKPISEKNYGARSKNFSDFDGNFSRAGFTDRDNFSDFDGNSSWKNRDSRNEENFEPLYFKEFNARNYTFRNAEEFEDFVRRTRESYIPKKNYRDDYANGMQRAAYDNQARTDNFKEKEISEEEETDARLTPELRNGYPVENPKEDQYNLRKKPNVNYREMAGIRSYKKNNKKSEISPRSDLNV